MHERDLFVYYRSKYFFVSVCLTFCLSERLPRLVVPHHCFGNHKCSPKKEKLNSSESEAKNLNYSYKYVKFTSVLLVGAP